VVVVVVVVGSVLSDNNNSNNPLSSKVPFLVEAVNLPPVLEHLVRIITLTWFRPTELKRRSKAEHLWQYPDEYYTAKCFWLIRYSTTTAAAAATRSTTIHLWGGIIIRSAAANTTPAGSPAWFKPYVLIPRFF